GLLYRRFIRPRLGPAAHTEAEAPPRFAQAMGMVIGGLGLICLAAGATPAGLVFTALALVAAFLNAAFDLCLGCHVYLFIQRNQRVPPSAEDATGEGGPPTMSRSDVLVAAAWAEAHIGDPGVVIVEVDEDTSAYDKGHIPTAVKIDWKKDLQDPVRRDFVDKTGFEALL